MSFQQAISIRKNIKYGIYFWQLNKKQRMKQTELFL